MSNADRSFASLTSGDIDRIIGHLWFSTSIATRSLSYRIFATFPSSSGTLEVFEQRDILIGRGILIDFILLMLNYNWRFYLATSVCFIIKYVYIRRKLSSLHKANILSFPLVDKKVFLKTRIAWLSLSNKNVFIFRSRYHSIGAVILFWWFSGK